MDKVGLSEVVQAVVGALLLVLSYLFGKEIRRKQKIDDIYKELKEREKRDEINNKKIV